MVRKNIIMIIFFLIGMLINLFLIFQGYTNNTYILNQNSNAPLETRIQVAIIIAAIITFLGFIGIIFMPYGVLFKIYKEEYNKMSVIEFLDEKKIQKYYGIISLGINLFYPLILILIRKINNDQYINYFVLQYLFQILLSSLVIMLSLNISKRLLYTYSINYYKYYVIIFYYFIIYKFLEYLSQFQELNIIQYTILVIFIIINITWIILAYKTNYTYRINKIEIKLPKVIKRYPISKTKLMNETPLTKEEEKIFILLQEKATIEEKDNITCLKYEDQYAIISDEQTDKCTPYNALIAIRL